MKHENQSGWIWVDWENHIISFHKEEGFSQVSFPNREEMMAFAVQKSLEGFCIK